MHGGDSCITSSTYEVCGLEHKYRKRETKTKRNRAGLALLLPSNSVDCHKGSGYSECTILAPKKGMTSYLHDFRIIYYYVCQVRVLCLSCFVWLFRLVSLVRNKGQAPTQLRCAPLIPASDVPEITATWSPSSPYRVPPFRGTYGAKWRQCRSPFFSFTMPVAETGQRSLSDDEAIADSRYEGNGARQATGFRDARNLNSIPCDLSNVTLRSQQLRNTTGTAKKIANCND